MKDKRDFEKEIEYIRNSKKEILPKEKYFEKIWDSIEYKAPVGQKYYLRFFFSLLFILAFIIFFFFYYSDFISSVLTLEKLQRENKRFVSIQNNTKRVHNKNKIKRYTNLTIRDETDSNYSVKENNNNYIIRLGFGHIKLKAGISSDDIKVSIFCPDIKLLTGKAIVDIFCYDNIIRIIPIEGQIEYNLKLSGKSGKIIPGESFFLLNRKKTVRD